MPGPYMTVEDRDAWRRRYVTDLSPCVCGHDDAVHVDRADMRPCTAHCTCWTFRAKGTK